MEKYTDQDIDDFILDQMGVEEHLAFCENLENDEELREKVALRQLIVEAERHLAEKEVRKIMEQKPQERLGVKRLRVASIIIAAALIGVVFMIGYSPKYSAQDIFREYYSIPMIERPRGGTALSMEDAVINNQIITHFENKEYKQVAAMYQEQWQEQLPTNVSSATLLYIAVSYIESDLPKQAIPVLSRVNDTDYTEEAKWLLLCAYLGVGDKEQAGSIAGEMAGNSLHYKEMAKEIQTKLKQRVWF
ncbi:hypothetical protein [Bacteroides sp. 51]|uniref:hypothetical protein n=1 Tax=Bacteroides sp. 51 TaxID=2302938 RepID=UPI0013D5E9CD|nr:hypothetical protein [Bacteroides sp. 51]NDV80513.1 hypothetical protein [Bacteroides sp. 51]